MAVISPWTTTLMITIMMITTVMHVIDGSDNNPVYSPCADTKVERSDGFTFGIAFASKESFQRNGTVQLSPCDSRLSLSSNAQISVFRPKVDEISLLSVNSSSFNPDTYGFMVAFAGRKYAARSLPTFVANGTYTVTSFTLVLEFNKGRLQNLYWKKDGCSKCSGSSDFVCLNNQHCAFKTSSCKNHGGSVDCSLGIQLAFSGTDKHLSVLNSWYEVANLRQYSLYGLYSNLKDSLSSQYSKIF
ncbi:hypothetical protein FF1_014051 [Malus domestica]|uniref:uncharacterized protein LOC126600830 n=1 Tax=Malus sylvestris TaxID=3752 RepID=UPI0010A9A7CC|nr:uncharacterized protein LOC103424296 [Malus domestica]XP_050123455.1 uncharacterized protein LOC126600830 [Malus sylvestris]